MKIPSEITFETRETKLTSIVIYLPYRLTSSDATIGVVFLFMLVNWWVEKHQRFLFLYKRFFWSRFYVFNVVLFFPERF